MAKPSPLVLIQIFLWSVPFYHKREQHKEDWACIVASHFPTAWISLFLSDYKNHLYSLVKEDTKAVYSIFLPIHETEEQFYLNWLSKKPIDLS